MRDPFEHVKPKPPVWNPYTWETEEKTYCKYYLNLVTGEHKPVMFPTKEWIEVGAGDFQHVEIEQFWNATYRLKRKQRVWEQLSVNRYWGSDLYMMDPGTSYGIPYKWVPTDVQTDVQIIKQHKIPDSLWDQVLCHQLLIQL